MLAPQAELARQDSSQTVNCTEKRQNTLYEHVKRSSELEELLVLNATLVACAKGLQPVHQPLFDALVASFRKCGQQEGKINDKAQALYNQV